MELIVILSLIPLLTPPRYCSMASDVRRTLSDLPFASETKVIVDVTGASIGAALRHGLLEN